MYTQKEINKNIWLYYATQFLTGALFTIPIWVAFEKQFLTYSQMSLLESSVFIIGLIFEIPSSALADLIGRKKTILLGWLITAVSYITIGISNNLIGLIVGMSFVGIGGALISGADTALIYDFLKYNKREDYYSKLNVFGNLFYRSSMILAIYIGGYLSTIQLSYGYLLRGIFQMIALLPMSLLIEVPFKKERIDFKTYGKQIKQGFTNIRDNEYLKDVVIYYSFVAAITWTCLYYFNNTFATDAGYNSSEQGKYFTIIYIITTTILLYITTYSKFIDKTKYVLYAFPIILTASLLPGIFATKITAFFMLIGVILAGGARFSILDSLLNKLLDSKDRATTLSTINMFVNIIFIFLMIFGGKLQEMYTTKSVFTFMGIICLLIVIPYTRLIIKKHNI